MRRVGLAWLLAFAVVLVAGCAGEEGEESVDALLKEGKACLSVNDYGCAGSLLDSLVPVKRDSSGNVIDSSAVRRSYFIDEVKRVLLTAYNECKKECISDCQAQGSGNTSFLKSLGKQTIFQKKQMVVLE